MTESDNMDTIEEIEKQLEAAQGEFWDATRSVRAWEKLLEEAHWGADFHALREHDKSTLLTRECPQGRDAKRWINRGWVDRKERMGFRTERGTAAPAVAYWTWSRKAIWAREKYNNKEQK
jgi:hypothetical protein